MQLALEAVPITSFKNGPNEVVKKIAQQPLLLTQHGRTVAVVVHPDQWNEMVTQLSERRFSAMEMQAVAKAYQKRAAGMETITGEELKAKLAERYGDAANKI
ncbi:MAG: type II toxin-antitoxin system Phd/YefM family antitoxin [Caldilineaceae bacterium]